MSKRDTPKLTILGRFTGATCLGIAALQMSGGTRIEPGMAADPTVDSHVRFMGAIFAGYGFSWLSAARSADLGQMRQLAGLMALGGLARLGTRAAVGRPHRFHDALLAVELAAPVIVEAAARSDRRT